MNDLTTEFIDVFKSFEQYPTVAPKNLAEMESFQQLCVEQGFEELAEWVFNWRTHMEYQIMAEWKLHDESED